ncbi:hypothetical protein Stube_26660 [Streptomyces tubercidicus]|uniref:Uncharacterized protein n=1 Tax=Streptomyces tubercidicus TaxID=47759 RepID=A0A640UPP8_9ACTN|nr:hypothetical protein Stube_26660 [Streptomyces tubercidicus]
MGSQAVKKPSAGPFAGTSYEGSPDGWWTEYGGALDASYGVVHLPPGSPHVPCKWQKCRQGCREKERGK